MYALRQIFASGGIASGLLVVLCTSNAGAWEKILPHHFGRYPVPPRVYGYPLDDNSAGYYGGLRYREYNAFGRGYFLADFPDSVPNYNGRWLRYRQWPYAEWEPPMMQHGPHIPPNCACVTVNVPPEAEVWMEGKRSSQQGKVRTFYSPPLPPNQKFVYQVRARWHEGAGRREQVREVVVHSGGRVTVRFPEGLGEETELAPLPRLASPPKVK